MAPLVHTAYVPLPAAAAHIYGEHREQNMSNRVRVPNREHCLVGALPVLAQIDEHFPTTATDISFNVKYLLFGENQGCLVHVLGWVRT